MKKDISSQYFIIHLTDGQNLYEPSENNGIISFPANFWPKSFFLEKKQLSKKKNK